MFTLRKQKKSAQPTGSSEKGRIFKGLFRIPRLNVGAKLQSTIILTVAVVLGVILVVVTTSYRNSIIGDRKDIMQSRLDTIAIEIAKENEQVGSIVMSLALAVTQAEPGDRIDLLEFSKALLQEFPNLMGTYINFEPNADGLDAEFADRALYTDRGRFIPYWYWQDPLAKDVLLLMPTEELDTSEKYAGAKEKWLEYGMSAANEKNLLFFSEPYVDQGIPKISVSYPIIKDGDFMGIAGANRSLMMLTESLKKFKPFSSADVFLLSRAGDFVAATGEYVEEGLVGRNINNVKELTHIFQGSLATREKGIVEIPETDLHDARYFVFSPVPFGDFMLAMEVDKDEIVAPVNEVVYFMVIFTAISFLVLAGVIWGISRLVIVRPIRNIMDLFGEIGMGNFEARAKIDSDDEIGEMASSLNAMLDNTLVLIQSREERDEIQASIMRLLEEISGLAEGDLSRRAVVTAEITGAIADSFNTMAEQLSGVVKDVKEATEQVTSTTQKVNASSTQLARASEVQARQVAKTKEAITGMAASIKQVAKSAMESAAVSEKSTMNAKEGSKAVEDTNKAMEKIRQNVQETSRSIKRLGESSQEIGKIVQLINDIADRTSILALNASIQAAMAGDAGRGFAVVAEEVQRLAERSTNATKQIDTLIKSIQGEINEAGSSMEESIQRVVEGSSLADDAHQKLQEIEAVSNQLANLIQSISLAATEQAKSSENITKTMEEMGAVSSKNLAASRQTTQIITHLATTSDKLADSISTFRLEEDVQSPAAQPKTAPRKLSAASPKSTKKETQQRESSLLEMI